MSKDIDNYSNKMEEPKLKKMLETGGFRDDIRGVLELEEW
jgi:hypothetical protein